MAIIWWIGDHLPQNPGIVGMPRDFLDHRRREQIVRVGVDPVGVGEIVDLGVIDSRRRHQGRRPVRPGAPRRRPPSRTSPRRRRGTAGGVRSAANRWGLAPGGDGGVRAAGRRGVSGGADRLRDPGALVEPGGRRASAPGAPPGTRRPLRPGPGPAGSTGVPAPPLGGGGPRPDGDRGLHRAGLSAARRPPPAARAARRVSAPLARGPRGPRGRDGLYERHRRRTAAVPGSARPWHHRGRLRGTGLDAAARGDPGGRPGAGAGAGGRGRAAYRGPPPAPGATGRARLPGPPVPARHRARPRTPGRPAALGRRGRRGRTGRRLRRGVPLRPAAGRGAAGHGPVAGRPVQVAQQDPVPRAGHRLARGAAALDP